MKMDLTDNKLDHTQVGALVDDTSLRRPDIAYDFAAFDPQLRSINGKPQPFLPISSTQTGTYLILSMHPYNEERVYLTPPTPVFAGYTMRTGGALIDELEKLYVDGLVHYAWAARCAPMDDEFLAVLAWQLQPRGVHGAYLRLLNRFSPLYNQFAIKYVVQDTMDRRR